LKLGLEAVDEAAISSFENVHQFSEVFFAPCHPFNNHVTDCCNDSEQKAVPV